MRQSAHKMSWGQYLGLLNRTNDYCRQTKQDWPQLFCGTEGSGKSTLAYHTANHLDKEFNLKAQIVDSLADYCRVTKKLAKQPYKALFLDEAVKLFFSREFSARSNVILVKLFISNRSFQHYNLLTIPNPFYVDKYIREWRLRTMCFSWIDRNDFNKRYFGYYTRPSFKNFLFNPTARMLMLDTEAFIRKFPPDFIAPFPKIEGEEWEEYSKIKEQNQMKLLDDALTEAMKLEDAKKVGFNRNTPLKEFLRWLESHFGVWSSGELYLEFTQDVAAREAVTAKTNINYLVNRLLDEDYIWKLGRGGSYKVRQIGLDLMKRDEEEQDGDFPDIGV